MGVREAVPGVGKGAGVTEVGWVVAAREVAKAVA